MDLMTILLPLIGALVPILLPLFPGLNQLIKLIPQPLIEAMVKIKGGTVTWATSPAVNADALRAEITGLASAGASDPTSVNYKLLQQKKAELAAASNAGGILDSLSLDKLLPLIAIGGMVFLMMNQSGGCKKPAEPKAPVVTESPQGG